ncbi:MAG: SpoIIE family protein phosphatase [Planctomycetota bacterium]
MMDATEIVSLATFVDAGVLQQMQDRFGRLGQVSVVICSTDGTPLTRPTWGSRFSKLIGLSSRGSQELGGHLRALAIEPRPSKPVQCLAGVMLYAAMVRHEDRDLALIIVGTRSPIWPPADRIREIAAFYELDADDLIQATAELEANIGGTPEAAHRFADGLAETISTLYAQGARIQRQLTDLRAVHELSDLLSGTFDLPEILDVTVNRVVKVVPPVKASAIRLLDEKTGELIIKAVCNLSEEYLRKGPVVLNNSPIDGAAFAGETVYIRDTTTDPRIRYPENARREGLVSGLCVPLAHGGRTVGVLRVYTSIEYRFSESEEALLRSLASQAAAAIITNRLYAEQVEAERVQRQLEAASAIQRRMLPDKPPSHPALSFGCVYAPALQVSGDFFDFIPLDSGQFAVCIADVVGKGLPAALLGASVRSAVRSLVHDIKPLDHLMARVNVQLCRDTLPSDFATLVFGVFSPNGSTFTYCNAGHSSPLLAQGDQLTELATGGMAIGVQAESVYEVATLHLSSGDCLVFVTDGITEAMDFDGAAYGARRLSASIQRHRGLDAQQFACQIVWDVRRFVGLAEQSDDITVVVAQKR